MAFRAVDRSPSSLFEGTVKQEEGFCSRLGRLVKLDVNVNDTLRAGLALGITRKNYPRVLLRIDRIHLHDFTLAGGDDDVPDGAHGMPERNGFLHAALAVDLDQKLFVHILIGQGGEGKLCDKAGEMLVGKGLCLSNLAPLVARGISHVEDGEGVCIREEVYLWEELELEGDFHGL